MFVISGATIGWSHHHTIAHFYRSVLEGLAFELRRAVLAMEAANNSGDGSRSLNGGAVRVGGGGAQSQLLLQILADVLGREVIAAQAAAGEEMVAFGAAMHALSYCNNRELPTVRTDETCPKEASALLRVQPVAARHAHYVALYKEVYCPLLEAATSISVSLQRIGGERCD